MSADAASCLLCNEAALEDHHLSGRDPAGNRIDASFTVPLCLTHHVAEHLALRSQNIDVAPDGRWDPITASCHRLRRWSVFLGTYAETSDDPFLADLADHLTDLATTLTKHQGASQ